MAGVAGRYQQHPQSLMQKLHGNNPGAHGPVPGQPGPPSHHPFSYGAPQSPGYGFPPSGTGFGAPGSHPSPGGLHHASGPPNLHGNAGANGQQGSGSSSHPFSGNHLNGPGQGHHQGQHNSHQVNGHHGPHPISGQHSHLNGGSSAQSQPVATFAGSDSSFARQQVQLASQSRNSTSAHHHARAAHLQQRGMTTSGTVAIGDPTRHPSMSIGKPKEKDSNKRDTEVAGVRTSTVNSIRKSAAPGADTHASPLAKELNTAAVIEAEREKLGEPWTSLDMGGMHLRNLAPELFRYDFLTTLYVPHNNLTSLPPALSTLSHLILLDASGNKLTSVPPELGMLTNLRELLLFDNQLTNLPPELGTLHQLDMLGIEGNPLPENLRSMMEKEGTSGLIAYLRDSCPVPMPPPEREWIQIEADSFPTNPDTPEPENFSVLSFNVLCEKYATSHMYGYTPSWALAWKYRKELILQEILTYSPDIVCLQEVDGEQYEEHFLLNLEPHGWEGVYFPKSRARTMSSDEKRYVDGCAIFYKTRQFSLVEQHVVEFNQVAMRRPDFKKTEDLFNRVMRRDDIAVMALLEHKQSGARLIAANVHIYWDPEYRDVKLVQVAMMMDELSKTADQFARLPPKLSLGEGYEKAPHYENGTMIPTVICGDFNSVPESGVYEFLATGSVAGSHEDFMQHIYGTYTTEGISHKFKLKSSYSHLDSSPDKPTGGINLTNYVPGFQGVIDYIWYNAAALSTTGLLGEVDNAYLRKTVGFPNAHFPSDHIAIMAEFKIKPQALPAGKPAPAQFRPHR